MLGFAILTLRADNGEWLVATFVLLTVGSDIGGYVAGVLFGKHPMFPTHQPEEVLGRVRRVAAHRSR